LIFPEGKRTDAGEILPFQPGVGMLAARLRIPVVPVRLEGLQQVLHKSAKFPTPGRVRVKFGSPLRLEGDDYAALAKQIEDAIRNL
jgi:1-acyl-sn-glycerol-3-phosphate acyltransferase